MKEKIFPYKRFIPIAMTALFAASLGISTVMANPADSHSAQASDHRQMIDHDKGLLHSKATTQTAGLSVKASETQETAVHSEQIVFPAKLLPILSEETNSVISPHGIAAVLAMAAEGASEASLTEILDTLEFDSMEALRASVLAVKAEPCSAFTSENTITLLQGIDKMELLDGFKQKMADSYHAPIIQGSTHGLSSLELKNTADFKAKWLHKLKLDTSHSNRFRHADGTCSYPAYLSLKRNLRCYQSDSKNIEAVALPYKVENDQIPYEMVLIESKDPLTEIMLTRVFHGMKDVQCEAEFPEFTIENEHDLIPMMKKIGLTNIFNANVGPFDRIATDPLYAATFSQEAKIEVDKEGTVAKAVTRMSMVMGCSPHVLPKTVQINIDKPFHYFVRNTKSGEIIFMGKVNRLTDCERSRDKGPTCRGPGGRFKR